MRLRVLLALLVIVGCEAGPNFGVWFACCCRRVCLTGVRETGGITHVDSV